MIKFAIKTLFVIVGIIIGLIILAILIFIFWLYIYRPYASPARKASEIIKPFVKDNNLREINIQNVPSGIDNPMNWIEYHYEVNQPVNEIASKLSNYMKDKGYTVTLVDPNYILKMLFTKTDGEYVPPLGPCKVNLRFSLNGGKSIRWDKFLYGNNSECIFFTATLTSNVLEIYFNTPIINYPERVRYASGI